MSQDKPWQPNPDEYQSMALPPPVNHPQVPHVTPPARMPPDAQEDDSPLLGSAPSLAKPKGFFKYNYARRMAASDDQTQTIAQTFSTNANTARFKEREVAIKQASARSNQATPRSPHMSPRQMGQCRKPISMNNGSVSSLLYQHR
jgi:hypothetical protein